MRNSIVKALSTYLNLYIYYLHSDISDMCFCLSKASISYRSPPYLLFILVLLPLSCVISFPLYTVSFPVLIKGFSHIQIFLQLFPISSSLLWQNSLKRMPVFCFQFFFLFFYESDPVSAFIYTIPPKLFLSGLPIDFHAVKPKD